MFVLAPASDCYSDATLTLLNIFRGEAVDVRESPNGLDTDFINKTGVSECFPLCHPRLSVGYLSCNHCQYGSVP